tara:strand:+ start:560 stop:742 length:183 start_codon:yes stop_codon:yes gene_type:complete
VLGRILEMEKQLAITQNDNMQLSEQIRETQRYLIRLARNQSEITRRITKWPYIAIEVEKK